MIVVRAARDEQVDAGLDVARSAAIKHQLATVIFSLEMGRNEITMRLLSAEARVPLHHMRSAR
jgi:replicative DNA helicase